MNNYLLFFSNNSLIWYVDIINFLVGKIVSLDFSYQERKKFFIDVKHYYWEEPILYKHCVDQIIRRCVPEEEMKDILKHCHKLKCGGHLRGN